MDVREVKRGGPDAIGESICDVYCLNPPNYAVYRTDERVMVHVADDWVECADGQPLKNVQRAALAQVSPLRGEIAGLTGSWRDAGDTTSETNEAAANRFDRRVADALTLALEGDLANATLYLAGIKRDIDDVRAARARRAYIFWASGMAGSLLLIVALFLSLPLKVTLDDRVLGDVRSLLVAAGAGALGAFFSVALAIRSRAALGDLRPWDNAVDAVLRIVVGFIGGMVLFGLFRTGVVSSIAFGENLNKLAPTLANASAPAPRGSEGAAAAANDARWMLIAVIGFVAGFVERLVGDLLARSTLARDRGDPAAAPVPPGPPDKGAAVAARQGASRADNPDDHPLDDGCDVQFDAADATADEDLPAADGGVETQAAAPAPPPPAPASSTPPPAPPGP